MPTKDVSSNFLNGISAVFGVKSFIVLFLIFYAVFSLMLYRQIQIMAKKLPTSLTPFLKFMAIIHIGVVLAILFLVIGTF